MESYQTLIGLEIHVELKTRSKMFCGCSADYLRVATSKEGSLPGEGSYFASKPNTHVCPVCLGLPGALPVANKKALEGTVLAGLALGCQAPSFSKFDRKNYFYPDLPKGYQISQYDLPLTVNGKMEGVRIRRVHLEEDTAKLIHATVKGKKSTLIDFNRSGVPLMEVVTEPDMRSSQEAREFLKKLQQVLRYLGLSDCDMEKGSMRLEVNVSVKSKKTAKLPNYKVEIKNLNSFRFVEKAIDYEAKRQIQLIKSGKQPVQETRGWDEIKQATFSQRRKEEAEDYRYFPEPDLPPIRWSKKQLSIIKKQLPELPGAKMTRFQKEYGLSEYQARILIETKTKADYFEEAVKIGKKHKVESKQMANVIINKKVDLEKILPAELIQILVKKKARPTIKREELEKIINRVFKQNKKAVEDYRKGKVAAVEFLVGQVARETQGVADPNQTRKILLEKLKKL